MNEHRHLRPPLASVLAVEEAGAGLCGGRVGATAHGAAHARARRHRGPQCRPRFQERIALPASTLAHHLRFLAAGGLIEQERRGRAVISRAAYRRIESLAAYLLDECCTDARPSPQARAARAALRSAEEVD